MHPIIYYYKNRFLTPPMTLNHKKHQRAGPKQPHRVVPTKFRGARDNLQRLKVRGGRLEAKGSREKDDPLAAALRSQQSLCQAHTYQPNLR